MNKTSIFLTAIQLDSVERARFLAEACGDDESLRAEIEDLIRAHDARQTIVESAVTIVNSTPSHVGRYAIQGVLGEGGFGIVYLAQDEQLDRRVAVKVPHEHVILSKEQVALQMAEARTVANLDHPNIVPVFDVGSTSQFPCYIVSKYIDGRALGDVLRVETLSCQTIIHLTKTIAQALHYAHTKGLVHRDVKPNNILIDHRNVPFVVDFGLALRDEDVGKGPRFAGTPAYMSPEQARGEGHRVDGRSDIFSLGIVLYEMLSGRRPFRGPNRDEILSQIISSEPRPLRQYDERISREIDRICRKMLAKKASERYLTAVDLVEDLEHIVPSETHTLRELPTARIRSHADPTEFEEKNEFADTTNGLSMPPGQVIQMSPKGLRSFDDEDSDFYLDMLPGPRDRDGIPDSIRFWKSRIEMTGTRHVFSVGLIYGPSGCGKSSFVKAGLVPRLPPRVTSIYLNATPSDTERRLLSELRSTITSLNSNLDLKSSLAEIRHGRVTPEGSKVLIVLDQFEQWLHSQHDLHESELVSALRQCDGDNLQCLLLVRDDFWLATTRFMDELEIDLVPGVNTALVDLFDMGHAKRILRAFGNAYGKFQANKESKTQDHFLSKVLDGLSENGRVICVRLALFAEMMKSRDWSEKSLEDVGGVTGLGVAFLEETFNSRTSHPKHRLHQNAARLVLESLLPDATTEIKGHQRSYSEMLNLSGYVQRPKEFDQLIKILDAELRLITPIDSQHARRKDPNSTNEEKEYQLTHDFLVPYLREWLNQKQRATRRGRAELLLAERTSLWHSRSENRHLPSLWEHLSIRWLTNKRRWSKNAQRMMRRAATYHGLRFAVFSLLVLAVALTIVQASNSYKRQILQQRVRTAVDIVLNSRGENVPNALDGVSRFPMSVVEEEFASRTVNEPSAILAKHFGLARIHQVDVDFLVRQIKALPHEEVGNLVAALENAAEESCRKIVSLANSFSSEGNLRYSARLAIVAMYLGEKQLAREMCAVENRANPQRAVFIDEFTNWNAGLGLYQDLLLIVSDPGLKSSLLLAIPRDAVAEGSKRDSNSLDATLINEILQSSDTPLVRNAARRALASIGISAASPVPLKVPKQLRENLQRFTDEQIQIRKEIDEVKEKLSQRRSTEDLTSELKLDTHRFDPEAGLMAMFPSDSQFPLNNEQFPMVPGIVNHARSFNGKGVASTKRSFNPERTDSFSYGCWFLTAEPEAMSLIAKMDSDNDYRGFDVMISDGVLEAHLKHEWPDNVIKVEAAQALNDRYWHHVMVTYNGSSSAEGMSIYLDGIAMEKVIVMDQLTASIRNDVQLTIGQRSKSEHYSGLIDDVRIYNRELSADEVQQVVNLGVRAIIGLPDEKRTISQRHWLSGYHETRDKDLVDLLDRYGRASAALAKARQVSHRELDFDSWYINHLGMSMIKIPQGRFDRRYQDRDGESQQVILSRAFFLSDSETTRGQFQQFIDDVGYKARPQAWFDPDYQMGSAFDHPVPQVSWNDAILFCNWLSFKEGYQPCYETVAPANSDEKTMEWKWNSDSNGYRLPTEAEWEFACGSGTVMDFLDFEDIHLAASYAVFRSDGPEATGSKLTNEFGLFDMHGNLYEWCWDRYAPYPVEKTVLDPTGASTTKQRVIRGGAFNSKLDIQRSAYRGKYDANVRYSNIGFRVARTVAD